MHDDVKQKNTPEMHDIIAAASLLSRIPVPVDHTRAENRSNIATWAFPIIGAIMGLISGIIGLGAYKMGLGNGFPAIISVICLILLSGAIHEDGLADCTDGFWGKHSQDARLKIMKDSYIGVYGVLALVLLCALRIQALQEIGLEHLIVSLITIGAISRVPMIFAMRILPNPRQNGLSYRLGIPPKRSCIIALSLAFFIGIILLGWISIIVSLAVFFGALLVFLLALRKIGGQTGDVLGASQQISEIVGYIALIVLL